MITKQDTTIKKIQEFYTQTIQNHGLCPQGVGWNGVKAQELRFAQLCRILPSDNYSVLDLGCGYGALCLYIHQHISSNFLYVGLDNCAAMLEHAEQYLRINVPSHKDVSLRLTNSAQDLPLVDYILCSGTFNIRNEVPDSAWTDHILAYLSAMHEQARHGFAINFLTRYSDPEKMYRDHYYGDPCFLYDYCKRNLSRHVCIIDDYDLYDFTLVVRRQPWGTRDE